MNIIETVVRAPAELTAKLMGLGANQRVLTISADGGTEGDGKDKKKPNFKTTGLTGTSIWGEVFNEEYLSDLKGYTGSKAYDKMQRQDYQVAFVKRAIKAVIKSSEFHFEIAEGIPRGEEMAKACDWQLRKGFNKTFRENLNDMATHLFYGFAVFEPTDWRAKEIPDVGLGWVLHSLGFRAQKTITGWSVKGDEIEWVHQQSLNGGDNNIDVKIPGENLLVMTCDREGANFEGVSMLRPSYGPWWMKNIYLKLLGIGLEKSALGIILVTVPPNMVGKQPETDFLAAVANYITHQNSYLKKLGGKDYEGFDIEVIKIDFKATDVIEAIKLMDDGISASVLAMFGRLGQGGNGGAYNLGVAEIDFFFTSILDSVEYMCEKLQPIWNMFVEYNFGKQEAYPELKATLADSIGEAFARTLNYFYNAGIYTPQEEDEKWWRKKYKMPGLVEPFKGKGPAPAMPGAPTDEDAEDGEDMDGEGGATGQPKKKKGEMGRLTTQPPSYIKKIAAGINFKEFNAENEALAEAYNKEINSALLAMQDKYVNDVENKIRFNPKDPMGAVKNIEMGFTRQLKEALTDKLVEALWQGKKQGQTIVKAKKKAVKNALAAGKLATIDAFNPANRKWVKSTSAVVVSVMVDTLKKTGLLAAQTAVDQGLTPEAAAFAVKQTLDDWRNNENNLGSGALLPKGLDQGRDEAYEDAGLSMTGWIYRNDDPRTAICEWLDGRTIQDGDPNIERRSPPNHWKCDGYKIPIMSDEPQPETWDGWDVPGSILDAQSLLSNKCSCASQIPEHLKFLFERRIA